MSKLNITDIFPKNPEAWKDQATKELKGKPFENLLWELEPGITMQPYYTAVPKSSAALEAFRNAANYFQESPYMLECVEQANNTSVLNALKGGASGIAASTALSEEALANVQKEILWINSPNLPSDIAKEQKGVFGKTLTPSQIDAWDKNDFETFIDTGLAAGNGLESAATLFIDCSWLANSCVAPSQQIAFALQAGLSVLDTLQEKGQLSEETAGKLAFQFAINTNFYGEAVKVRSFLALWSIVLQKYGIKYSATSRPKIQTSAATVFWTVADENNNLLRATTSTVAAYVGGTDAHIVAPYRMVKKGTEISSRISRNVQHILQSESYLTKTKNAIDGSYLLEHAAEALMNKAWNTFVEGQGNGAVYSDDSKIHWTSVVSAAKKQAIADFKSQKNILVGINKYPATDLDLDHWTGEEWLTNDEPMTASLQTATVK